MRNSPMQTSKFKPLLPTNVFIKRVVRNLLISFVLVVVSLGLGMLGYHHFEKMSWVDAYENAAMILAGMGPVAPLKTECGKIFAGSYALFSGIVFLIAIAVIIAPIFHRFLHRFIINQYK